MRHTVMPSAMLLLAACMLTTGCGSETPFDPSTVSLVGTWRVSADMDLKPIVDGVVGDCHIRELNVTITGDTGPLPGTVWGSTGDGGTISCTMNGTSSDGPYLVERGLAITRSGDTVTIANAGGIEIFIGTLVSADSLEGTIGRYENAYDGTWSAVRQ